MTTDTFAEPPGIDQGIESEAAVGHGPPLAPTARRHYVPFHTRRHLILSLRLHYTNTSAYTEHRDDRIWTIQTGINITLNQKASNCMRTGNSGRWASVEGSPYGLGLSKATDNATGWDLLDGLHFFLGGTVG